MTPTTLKRDAVSPVNMLMSHFTASIDLVGNLDLTWIELSINYTVEHML